MSANREITLQEEIVRLRAALEVTDEMVELALNELHPTSISRSEMRAALKAALANEQEK